MALLKVHTFPDPILKKKAELMTSFDSKAQKFIDDLIETMWIEDGVGIAATQVGVSKRVFIAAPTMKRGEEYVIVNPDIIETKGRELGMEGCLSLPGLGAEVARPTRVRFKYQDREGKHHEMEVRDFFARVVMHETDHLDGILFIDRLEFEERQKLLGQYRNP